MRVFAALIISFLLFLISGGEIFAETQIDATGSLFLTSYRSPIGPRLISHAMDSRSADIVEPVVSNPTITTAEFAEPTQGWSSWIELAGNEVLEPWQGISPFAHQKNALFADLLIFSVREADTTYGAIVGPGGSPAGRSASIGGDYEAGFRVGGNWRWDDSQSLMATYWHYDAATTDSLTARGLTGIRPIFSTNPATAPAALSASVESEFDLDMLDVVYRRRITPVDQNFTLHYRLGFRAAEMDQSLDALYSGAVPLAVSSDVNFQGVGPRILFDAERIVTRQFLSYFRVGGSLLLGEVDANYRQTGPGGPVNTTWSDDRIVPVLEAEVGLGWKSKGGAVRVQTGYHIAAWFNSVTHDEWANSVRSGLTGDPSDTILLDGLTARIEFRW